MHHADGFFRRKKKKKGKQHHRGGSAPLGKALAPPNEARDGTATETFTVTAAERDVGMALEKALEKATADVLEKAAQSATETVSATVTLTATVTATVSDETPDREEIHNAEEEVTAQPGTETKTDTETQSELPSERPRLTVNGIKRFAPPYKEDDSFLPDPLHRESGLILTAHAAEQLRDLIDWGERTERNSVEQQGIMLGEVYETPYGFTGIVEEFIMSSAIGNSVYIESSFTQWSEMDRRMDEINEAREQKLVKIGWWHTHPSLGIFMSGTDRKTQARYFYQPWQFAAVFDPHAKKWGAFLGENATPCFGTVQKKEGEEN